MRRPKIYIKNYPFLFIFFIFSTVCISAQTTAFTYQGRLTDGVSPANGTYEMQFRLFDAVSAGMQIGSTVTNNSVTVTNGIFSVSLDFGSSPFAAGANRWLEIGVRKASDPPGFTILAPRQQISSSPYAVKTISAASADSLSPLCIGCVTDANINSVSGSKLIDTVAIANGGTGSTTKNFVDLTNAQTIGGTKTFSDGVNTSTFNVNGGGSGVSMNDNLLRLRNLFDSNHGIIYNAAIDGPEFRAFGGFRWANGASGANTRMRLDNLGNLTVTGTINGTLANDSVGSAQVADASLRLTDIAVFISAGNIGTFVIGAHGCTSFNANLPVGNVAVGDIVYIYPLNTTPAGFYIQPTTVTSLPSVLFSICNTLNVANTFPAQSLRLVVMRP